MLNQQNKNNKLSGGGYKGCPRSLWALFPCPEGPRASLSFKKKTVGPPFDREKTCNFGDRTLLDHICQSSGPPATKNLENPPPPCGKHMQSNQRTMFIEEKKKVHTYATVLNKTSRNDFGYVQSRPKHVQTGRMEEYPIMERGPVRRGNQRLKPSFRQTLSLVHAIYKLSKSSKFAFSGCKIVLTHLAT